jgi:glutamate/tyrosine decarboxylase-like PLP-dependent enzyme
MAGLLKPRQPPESAPVAADASAARSLDPADWESFRRLAHAALEQAVEFLRTAGARPVWQPVPESVKAALAEPPPLAPQGLERVLGDVQRLILPYTCGNTHPRFFGWVHGTGTPGGIVAEMLAAAINANLGGREHSPVYVERQVIEWCRQLFSFPETASGLVVSGTSMATVVALTVARNHALGAPLAEPTTNVRARGLLAAGRQLVAYASKEAHGSVAKALELIGIGGDNLRAVPVDSSFRMDAGALAGMIDADRRQDLLPFAVIATAGTVNTAAIDPLTRIADVCRERDVWMHVDGAFGAAAILSPDLSPRLAGIERADSLAFDFHKWLHVPYDAGCVLIRHAGLQLAAFSQRPAYLQGAERGLAAGDPWLCELGPELSRGFRALKVWFTLKEHGLEALGRQVEKNCAQARHLAERVASSAQLELLAPVALNIVCFRAVLPGLDAAALDRLNGEIVSTLQERGVAAPSTTRINGALAIRVNITNHRTRLEDVDILLDAVRELALDRLIERVESAQRRAPALQAPAPARKVAAAGREALEQRLREILARPELTALARNVRFVLEPGLAAPFDVVTAKWVQIAPESLADVEAGAVLVRHALELALWLDCAGERDGPEWAAALSLAGARTAALYLSAHPRAQRLAAAAGLPEWLRETYERIADGKAGAELREILTPQSHVLDKLLRLRSANSEHLPVIRSSARVRIEAGNLLLRMAELARPAEVLLTSGGDSRVAPLAETGRNAYHAGARPDPEEISFSSSTASTISQPAYEAVERLRHKLIRAAIAGRAQSGFRKEMSAVRAAVSRVTGAGRIPGAAVILTASGTDTELSALHFALAGSRSRKCGPLLSIIIDANETGSGVPLAAQGRHFLGLSSQGAAVEAGAPVAGFEPGAVEMRCVGLRRRDGSPRSMAEIDSEIAVLVREAIGAGRRCLLRVLDSSKTGIGAPSIEAVLRLKERHPRQIDVMVDACQMRLDTTAMQAYLARGCMLQITGSKFYTGPAFAGALVLPGPIARRKGQLPAGLADYVGEAEWPASLEPVSETAGRRRNLGLLARWTAALHEIRDYRRIPSESAHDILRAFAREAAALIGSRPGMELIEVEPFSRTALGIEDAWQDTQTILPFALFRTGCYGEPVPLGLDDLKHVHRLLAEDIADRLPAGALFDEFTARARCVVGQPVRIAAGGARVLAVLRLCSSARVVARAARQTRTRKGKASGLGVAALTEEARIALDKASLIVRYLPELRG